jgi:antitoxin component of MazEF toxin-antitoxin module
LDVGRLRNVVNKMKKNGNIQIVLRPKRQVTLPRDICEKLGLNSGDVLELSIEGQNMIAKPRKTRSLDALKAIQAAFQQSGLSESELQETGREVRRQIILERYGKQA